MRSNWKKSSLSEIINFRNGKKRPALSGRIPVYGGNGVLGYASDFNYKNCVIIGRVGAYCGSVYHEKGPCWVSDNAIAALPNDENDVLFVYYLLKSLSLNRRCIGTSQPLLTQEILSKIECVMPESASERLRIASILRSIDEKIEINYKINDNLVA